MDINTLRKATNSAKASISAAFEKTPLRKHLDSRLEEEASKGNDFCELNFYGCKYSVYGDEYVGPSINDAIDYYNSKGFTAQKTFHCAPNGHWNTCLKISW